MSGRDDEPGPSGIVRILQTITPNAIRRRYALKFAIALLFMAVVIGAVGFVATERISAQAQESVESEYRNVATQEANIVEEVIRRNTLSTRLLSQNSVWGNDEDLGLVVQREAAGFGQEISDMHVVDIRDGTAVVAASTSMNSGTSLEGTDRSWVSEQQDTLQGLQADDVHFQGTYEVGSGTVIAFASPVTARQGRFLIIEVPTATIADSLRGQDRAEGGFTQVIDSESNLVMIDERSNDDDHDHSHTLELYADNEESLAPIRRAERLRDSETEAGVIAEMPANSRIIDETYTVGFAPVEGTDWVVVTHAPRSSVFGLVQSVSNFGLLTTVTSVLLVFVVGTILGRNTSKAIDRLRRKTEQMRQGDLDVSFRTTRVDNIGRLYDAFAEMRDALETQINEAEQARKEAEVSRAEAEEMSRYFRQKAEEHSRKMQECATGDLTQRMTTDGKNDSMDKIATEFNDMVEELEKTIGQLKSYVDEVDRAGAKVESSADTVRDASEQVANSIQRIAIDTEEQKERLEHLSEVMDAIATDLEALAEQEDLDVDEELDRITEVTSEIEELTRLGEETQSETDNVSAAAEEQAAELSDVSERAHDLQRYAQPLRDILERFDTEAEHEFVFSVGPTGGRASASQVGDEEIDQ